MQSRIAAIIAAAGQSSRMGVPKQLLPWGKTSVIQQVVSNLDKGGASPVVCVLGRERQRIATELASLPVHIVVNADFQSTEMLASFQMGLHALERLLSTATDGLPPISGSLFSLGDQPHVSHVVIKQIVALIQQTPERIVMPSHNMRRGHPFYLPRSLWSSVTNCQPGETMRHVLRRHESLITYVDLTSDEILWDMDTPEDYAALRERWDSNDSL